MISIKHHSESCQGCSLCSTFISDFRNQIVAQKDRTIIVSDSNYKKYEGEISAVVANCPTNSVELIMPETNDG